MNIFKRSAAIITAIAAIGAYIPASPYLHEQQAYAVDVQTVEADIDLSQYDLHDFETVCKLTADYGECIRTGNQILIINLIEDYGFRETYVGDTAVVLALDEGTYSLSKLNGISSEDIYTSRGHLTDVERIRKSDVTDVIIDRECFYHCLLITADNLTDGELYVTYTQEEKNNTYSFSFEKNIVSGYKISDVVDVEDYDQLSYIINTSNGYGACCAYGDQCLLLSPSYIEPAPMVEAGPDYDYSSYYSSLESQGIEVSGFEIDGDIEYNVLKSGKCDDPNKEEINAAESDDPNKKDHNDDRGIFYSIIEVTSPGEARAYAVGDNTERKEMLGTLYVNENGQFTSKSNIVLPGDLVLEPKNIYQVNAMRETCPEGFKYAKYFDSKKVYFFNDMNGISSLDEIIVNTSSKYSLNTNEYTSVFTPCSEGTYIVTLRTINEAIVKVGNTHCHYFYPIDRNYYVRKGSRTYLTVNFMGEKSYYDKDIAEKLSSHKDDMACFSYHSGIDESDTAEYYQMVYNSLDEYWSGVDVAFLSNHHSKYDYKPHSDLCVIAAENSAAKTADELKVSGVGEISNVIKIDAPENYLDGDTDAYNGRDKFKYLCLISLTDDNGYVEIGAECEYYRYEHVYTVNDGVIDLNWSTYEDMEEIGDLNFDSEKNIADLVLINKQMLRRTRFCNTQLRFADMDKDGMVDGFDMILMRRMLINLAIPRPMN